MAIPLINDDVAEDDELFEVTLIEPMGGVMVGDDSSVSITILANDNAHGIIEFSKVVITFTRSYVIYYLD